jgi:CheY-like chemotaxis protein
MYQHAYYVDDNDIDRLIVNALNQRKQVFKRLSVFQSPHEALTCLEQDRPDIILLDIVMPLMSGFEFLDELQKRDCTVPVHILSVSILPQHRAKARQYPQVKGYHSKPLRVDRLASLLSY